MDQSGDSGTSEDENLETKVIRLNRNVSDTLEAARKAQSLADLENEARPRLSYQPQSHKLSLKFPAPTYRTTIYSFDDDRYSEDIVYSYESDASEEAESLRFQRVSMQLEDLLSSVSRLFLHQEISLSKTDLALIQSQLRDLTPGDRTQIQLGNLFCYVRLTESEEEIALKYAQILEASEGFSGEEMQSSPPQFVETELGSGQIEAELETGAPLEEKMEELQSAWDLLLEQRRDLDLREQALEDREQMLRMEVVNLERAKQDLESARLKEEQVVLQRTVENLTLKEDVERLLKTQIESNTRIRVLIEDKETQARRSQFEQELQTLRDQAAAYLAAGHPANEIQSHLDQAEEGLVQAVTTGNTAKFRTRLAALKTVLARIKADMVISYHASKAEFVSSTLSAMDSGLRAVRSRANVQRRVLERCTLNPMKTISPDSFAFYQKTFQSGSTVYENNSPFRSELGSTGKWSAISRGSADLSPTHFPPAASPGLESTISKESSVYEHLYHLSERRLDLWRTLAQSLQGKLHSYGALEKDLSLTQANLRTWEKRLVLLEKEVKERENASKSRAAQLAKKEDEALLRYSQALPAFEVRELLQVSNRQIQAEKAVLDATEIEIGAMKTALETSKVELKERTQVLETQWKELTATQRRLAQGCDLLDAVARNFSQFLQRLKP